MFLQGGLMVLTALCSLYLLSALGVENDPSSIVFVTRSLGIVSMGVAVLIGLLHYWRRAKVWEEGLGWVEARGNGKGIGKGKRSTRILSAGELQQGMAIGAFQ
ncbi:hypothetical protein TrLO_g12505 [Triparma laevis f. longispina]|uniref:Uncharacterized protein n=1 Tax=Triparma laevis f. longispina TaxID=1714387 RepID=A0A9W7FMG9_9STRA|nr:hypothetical protein TrLO_g12505 [Triparma laevis f. longispina]